LVEHSSLRYRKPEARQAWIVSTLQGKGFLSVSEISREFDVSQMTVRRDLQQLAQTGQVRILYGGVGLSLEALRGSGAWATDNGPSESSISRCAATLVGEDDAIAIDAGRGGYEVARALPEEFRGTVITNSISVIQLLASRSKPPRIVGLGGEVMADRRAFGGAGTLAAIAGVRVRTVFLAVDAIDHRGAYAHIDAEAQVKRALLGIADQAVVLADHDRFADSAPLLIATLRQLATVVTDRRPSDRMQHALRYAGVQLLVGQGEPHSPSSQPAHLPGPAEQAGPIRQHSSMNATSSPSNNPVERLSRRRAPPSAFLATES
jgi:DeoR/GlpR family transcriptional regulator of sugar metabolism